MKITEALLAEHAVFHTLFDHLERALPRTHSLNEVKALGEVLESALTAHSKAEDLLLLDPLEHCLQELGQSDTFHHEHQEISDNLKMVQTVRNVRQARIRLQDALTWSRAHFEKEERFIFPMAEKVLSTRTLAELGERWHKERKVITG